MMLVAGAAALFLVFGLLLSSAQKPPTIGR
jgi:hypothetical protein